MSAQTIQRGFNKSNSLISAAKEKENSFAYSIKKFFYTLFTFGFGKAMEEARSERRENEIVGAAFDILNGLPKEHKDLTKSEFDRKILHTNFNKKYQLVQEREELCLYTGDVSRSPLDRKCNFDKDMHSRTVLKKFSGSDFSDFKTKLNQVKVHPIFKTLEQQQQQSATKIQSFYRMSRAKNEFAFLNKEITFCRELKIKECKNNLTLKDCIIFDGSSGTFNNLWKPYLGVNQHFFLKFRRTDILHVAIIDTVLDRGCLSMSFIGISRLNHR